MTLSAVSHVQSHSPPSACDHLIGRIRPPSGAHPLSAAVCAQADVIQLTRGDMHIELLKGERRWYWRLVAQNGNIVATSHNYYSGWNAKRGASKFAKANGLEVREV